MDRLKLLNFRKAYYALSISIGTCDEDFCVLDSDTNKNNMAFIKMSEWISQMGN